MEGIIKRLGGISNDTLYIKMGGLDEVDSRNIMDGLAILIDKEVEGNAVFTEVLDVNQRG